MAWPETMPAVFLEWVDSQQDGDWHHLKDWLRGAPDARLLCRSIGWIAYRDNFKVILVRDLSDSACVGGGLHIPQKAIVRELALTIPEGANG